MRLSLSNPTENINGLLENLPRNTDGFRNLTLMPTAFLVRVVLDLLPTSVVVGLSGDDGLEFCDLDGGC